MSNKYQEVDLKNCTYYCTYVLMPLGLTGLASTTNSTIQKETDGSGITTIIISKKWKISWN